MPENLIPNIKQSIEKFLFEEEGNITRNKILTVGSVMLLMGIVLTTDVFAGHSSHRSHSSHSSHSSGSSSHSSHSSHTSSAATHSSSSTPSHTSGATPSHSSGVSDGTVESGVPSATNPVNTIQGNTNISIDVLPKTSQGILNGINQKGFVLPNTPKVNVK